MSTPKFSFKDRVKAAFGKFTLTSFESDLIKCLRDALPEEQREILDDQFARFNKTVRLIRDDGSPGAYGYTEFHRTWFGKPVLDFPKKFINEQAERKIATVTVVGDSWRMYVEYRTVHGTFFSMKYRSQQRVFYPPSPYKLQDLKVLLPSPDQV